MSPVHIYKKYLTVDGDIDGPSIVLWIGTVSFGFLGLIVNAESFFTLVGASINDVQEWSSAGLVLLVGGFAIHFLLLVEARDHYHQQRFTDFRGITGIWLAQALLILAVVFVLRLGVCVLLNVPLLPAANLDILLTGVWVGGLFAVLGLYGYREIIKNPSRTEVAGAVDARGQRFNADFQERVSENLGRIDRAETGEALTALKEGTDVVLLGSGGVGKSGVMTAIVEKWEPPVLAIDSRKLGGVNTRKSLQQNLELPLPPDEALELLAQESTPLIAVDQLDTLPESDARKLLEQLLKTAKATDNVRILLSARARDYEKEPFFNRLEEHLQFQEVEVTELNGPETRSALQKIGIDDPTAELQFLCRRILNLDIVARLMTRGTDLSGIESRVQLWGKFRDEIVNRGTAELTDEEAPQIIRKAQEFARMAYENEHDAEFRVDVYSPEVEVLVGWGILTQRAETDYHRFSHSVYQEHFYALDTVRKERWGDPSTLLSDIPRSSHVPLVEWIIDLQLESDPGRFDDFLQQWLSSESVPARTRLGIVEYLTTISPEEFPEQARENLYEQLSRKEEHHQVFYEELGSFKTVLDKSGQVQSSKLHPAWLEQLVNDTRFTTLSEEQEEFLQVHSGQHPALVKRALEQFVPSDETMLRRGLWVLSAVSLPNQDEVRLVEEWLASTGEEDRIPSGLLYVFKQLVTRGDAKQAVALLRIIASRGLTLGPDGFKTGITDIRDHQEDVRTLAQRAPNQVAPQLRDVLVADIDAERDRRSSIADEDLDIDTVISLLWEISRPPAEATLPISHPREPEEIRTIYLLCYREALDEWIATAPDDPDLRRELIRLMNSDIAQFHWVAASVLPPIADRYPEFVSDLLVSQRLYRFPSCHEALTRLWRDGFEHLDNPDRSNVAVFVRDEAVSALTEIIKQDASEKTIRALYDAIDEQIISTDPDTFERFRANRPPPEVFSDDSDTTDLDYPSAQDLSAATDLVARVAEVDKKLWSDKEWVTDEQEAFAANVAEVVLGDLKTYATELASFADIDPVYFATIINRLLSEFTAEPAQLEQEAAVQVFETCVSMAGASGPGAASRYHATRLAVTLLDRRPDPMIEFHMSRIHRLLSNALTPPWDEFTADLSGDDWLTVSFTWSRCSGAFGPVGTIPACATVGIIYLAEAIKDADSPDKEPTVQLLDEAFHVDDESVSLVSGRLLWRVANKESDLVDYIHDAFFTLQHPGELDPAATAGWLCQPVLMKEDESLKQAFRELYPILSTTYERHTSFVLEEYLEESKEIENRISLEEQLQNIGDHLFAAWLFSIDKLPPEDGIPRKVLATCLDSEIPDISVEVLPRAHVLADITQNDNQRQQELLALWRWYADKYQRPNLTEDLSPLSVYIRWARKDTTLSLSQVSEPLRETFPTISEVHGDWSATEDLLEQHLENEPLLVIDLYHELLQHGIPDHLQYPGHSIVETTARHHAEERGEQLYEIVDMLVEAGYTGTQDLLNERDEFDL